MSIPFADFRPAEYHDCRKEKYISYYAVNPVTGRMHRKVIRLNHMKDRKARKQYAMHLCNTINSRLYSGWNPFKAADGTKGQTLEKAVGIFLREKGKCTRPATMVSYHSFCRIFLEFAKLDGFLDSPVNNVDDAVLSRFIGWVDRVHKPGPRTFNNYIGFISALFGFFAERGIIEKAPLPKVRKRTADAKKRVIIPPDVRKLIRGWFEANLPPFCAVMELCYKCFARPKEIVNLRLRDIDFREGTVTIPGGIAKNHRDRVLKLPDNVLSYFRTIADRNPSWYIFTGMNKYVPGRKPMSPTRISETWAAMRAELGLPDCYQFYSLKDTGITEMLEAGVPSKVVKDIADHSSLEITEKYMHRSGLDTVDVDKVLEF